MQFNSSRPYLSHEFGQGQVADEAGLARVAEGAADGAADLCGQADRACRGHGHGDTFNGLSIGKFKKQFLSAVFTQLALAHGQQVVERPQTVCGGDGGWLLLLQ